MSRRLKFGFPLATAVGALVVTAVVPAPAGAQEPAEVERTVGELMERYEIPGGAVAVVDGDGVAAYGLGSADETSGADVDPDRTVFPIDSVTKAFTATVVMSLVDEGVLDLDADVNEYLDRIEVEQTYPDRPVTLRHLLTHTAGFEEQVVGILGDGSGSVEDLEDHLAEHLPERVRPPGEVSAYSNYGLALAGQVAADAADVPFDRLASQRLLEPLQMRATSLSADPPDALEQQAATLYGSDLKPLERHGDLLYPAGGAMSTAADMGLFMRMHLEGGAPVLSEEATGELHSEQFRSDPRLPGLALAFHEEYRGETRMLTHGGDGPGSHSLLTLVPERDLGIFVVFNGDGRDGAAAAAAAVATDRLLDLLLGPSDSADGPAGQAAPATAAEATPGTYRTTRMNYSDYTSLFLALGSDVAVTVGEDGHVTTTGMSNDLEVTEQRWEPAGDGLYREQGGTRLIAFGEHDGRLMLYDGATAYEQVPWYRNATLLLGGAAAGLVILLSLLWWPAARLLRRVLGRRVRPAGSGERTASASAGTTAALIVAFVVAIAASAADSEQFELAVLQGTPTVALAAIPIALAVIGTASMAVCAVLAWRRRWWSAGRRLHYTLAAAGAAAFVAVAHAYHFTVAPLTLLG
ncbi:serine hydrolase domain-containing protein [Glycomyces salinus]|uniref:serine hydrolase domain-containing protein n=1 Tax=Glycomyces salinus TaxID=980294 RepID=UPI0018EBF14B|nr:serine hydrolase domain-containing protein [Glycomyces salinus]